MSNPSSHQKPVAALRVRCGWVPRLALVLGLFLLVGVRGMVADDSRSLEYQVKGAFLVKFASFVQWPTNAVAATNQPFTIGIFGEDPFGAEFEHAIRTEHVNDRPIRLKRTRDISALADCQIVFIVASESKHAAAVLRELEGKPVLVVSDDPESGKHGVMITFFKEAGRVRFELNIAAAERARLKFSAKLQQVSRPGGARESGGKQ